MLPCASTTPALAAALGTLLPGPDQTRLLRACLHRGAAGQRAWAAWRELVDDPASAAGPRAPSAKGWLPLLAEAQREQALAIHPELLTTLRAAVLRAELRNGAFFRISREILGALAVAGVRPVVLRGAALAATTYPRAALRHCHDLDLLVPAAEQERAAVALVASGLQAAAANAGSRCFAHPSGLPIVLHSRLFPIAYANVEQLALVTRAERTAALQPAAVLAPADALLHVLGHAAFSAKRNRFVWPIDAWQILTRRPDLDWARLVDTARTCRLALPVFALLRYLAVELSAPVPATVLDQLASHVPDVLEREGALFGAQAGPGWSYLGFLHQASGWRARAAVLQWLLLPSPAYLASVSGIRRSPGLPLYYVGRLLRQCGRELTGQGRLLGPRFRPGRAAPATAPMQPRRD